MTEERNMSSDVINRLKRMEERQEAMEGRLGPPESEGSTQSRVFAEDLAERCAVARAEGAGLNPAGDAVILGNMVAGRPWNEGWTPPTPEQVAAAHAAYETQEAERREKVGASYARARALRDGTGRWVGDTFRFDEPPTDE
jgi:hypothetical protein